jgi:hypothetical protein
MDPLSMLFNISLVLLGGILGYYLNQIQNNQTSKESEIKEIKQIIKSLLFELEYNFSVLQKGLGTKKSLTGTDYVWFTGSFQTRSYDSIVNSGDLTLLDPEIQTSVSIYYEKINELNFIGHETMPFPIGGSASQNVNYQKTLHSALKEAYPELKEYLESSLGNQ